jgi:hypothetical protein
MDTESTDDDDTFVPDENEPEVAKSLDHAMSNIARALNTLHKLGVPQDLVLKLVESRANLRSRADRTCVAPAACQTSSASRFRSAP